MRVPQNDKNEGSQRWIKRGVNDCPAALNSLISSQLPEARNIRWRSPLAHDDYSEYRDADFLRQIGLKAFTTELKAFWPERGPQWDALAQYDNGGVMLVEAKAHIGEVFSSPCGAKAQSALDQISRAMNETIKFLDATPRADWTKCFYQLANRIAHLYFLRKNGVDAKLLLVNFVGHKGMDGPSSAAEWQAAYRVVWHVLGVQERHNLSSHIIDIFPDVRLPEWQS